MRVIDRSLCRVNRASTPRDTVVWRMNLHPARFLAGWRFRPRGRCQCCEVRP